jgi:hypothetical protein
MPTPSLPRSLADLLAAFGSCFTAPTTRTFQALVGGFLAQPGVRTVTGMLVAWLETHADLVAVRRAVTRELAWRGRADARAIELDPRRPTWWPPSGRLRRSAKHRRHGVRWLARWTATGAPTASTGQDWRSMRGRGSVRSCRRKPMVRRRSKTPRPGRPASGPGRSGGRLDTSARPGGMTDSPDCWARSRPRISVNGGRGRQPGPRSSGSASAPTSGMTASGKPAEPTTLRAFDCHQRFWLARVILSTRWAPSTPLVRNMAY